MEYLQFPEIGKNDKPSFGNQYLENIHLTVLGISNKKCGKHHMEYLQFLKIEKKELCRISGPDEHKLTRKTYVGAS